MPKKKNNPNKKINDAEVAKKWRTTPATAARWRRAGAPLADEKRLVAWLASRKNLPQGTIALLAERRKTIGAMGPRANQPLRATAGAVAALARLEAAEAGAFEAMVEAESSGDPVSIKVATRRWLELSATLLRFDIAISATRRGDDMVSMGKVIGWLGSFSWLWRIAVARATVSEDALRIFELRKNARQVQEILNRLDIGRTIGVIAALRAAWQESDPRHIPQQLLDALASDLDMRTSGAGMESIMKLAPVLTQVFSELTNESIHKTANEQQS